MVLTSLPLTKKWILYVDDSQYCTQLFSIFLSEAGYDVESAYSSIEALQLIETHQFNLCLFDLSLPDGSGLNLLEKVHAIHPSMPIIICSGYGDDSTQQQALLTGAIGYLTKPIDFELLVQTINQFVS
jgi:DNA-binding NtrC family response regulator